VVTSHAKLGEVLVRAGCVSAADVSQAMDLLGREGGSLGRSLEELGLAEEETVAAILASHLNLEYPGLDSLALAPGTAALLPPEFCRKRLVAPIGAEGKSLKLAMTNPLDFSTIQDVEFSTGMRVVVAVAGEKSIRSFLDRTYPAPPEEKAEEQTTYELLSSVEPAGEVEFSESEHEVADISKLARDLNLAPIVRLVNMILCDAAKAGASDIHIEPQEDRLQVRQRLDGLLKDVLKIPKGLQDSTVSRIKIISGMDIGERRRPQDGRSRLKFEGKRIDLRVSTLPTQFGEKVVIRLLDGASASVDLAGLGFSAENLRMMEALLSRPQGIFLVTGPTGSGKTSTLYAALNWVKASTKNIITVEDPIEFHIEGINQVQINSRAGMTFATGLRSILRQDPNIVFVGEIRDQETAGIAMEAAQTGHLLLSSLHTNDAVAAITRLLDLGIEPFLVMSSVSGILAQRLARRPCGACAAGSTPSADTVEKLGGPSRLPADAAWTAGAGCNACDQSGYRGRMAIHELLVVTDEIRDLISRRAPEHEIRAEARRAGMRSLMEDGIEKAAQGATTLEELVRVAPRDEAREADAPSQDPFASARPAAGAGTGSMKGRCVVVVEDSPTISTVIKYFMELEGFEVIIAQDGREGLDAARKHKPEVIISDVNMPGMDGLSMVKALRADPATSGAAILMLTSEDGVDSEAKGLEVGADDYIFKPVEPRRLAARVKSLLARIDERQGARS
jgi:type IV pilus assembly protein PilB